MKELLILKNDLKIKLVFKGGSGSIEPTALYKRNYGDVC